MPRGTYIIPGSEEEKALFQQHDIATKNLLMNAPASTMMYGGSYDNIRTPTTLPATMPVAPTIPMPTLGEYPAVPQMDESRLRYFTQRAARAPERALRRRTRKMLGKYDPNDPRYRFAMEGILGEFGSQLSNIYSQAGQTGRQEYMALEYAPKMAQWQMDIARIDKEFQAKMTNYMAMFGQKQTYTPEGKTTSSSGTYKYGVKMPGTPSSLRNLRR